MVIPVRNEGRFIEACLESLAAQDYPRARIEVVIVDDGSNDNSSELARHYGGFGWEAFRMIPNAGTGTAAARNTGVTNSAGDVIVQLIGHCALSPEYLSTAVATLNDRGVECVGGLITTVAAGATGSAIAAALSSPFGVGNARFRVGGPEGPVDTVAFGAYQRQVFSDIGLFALGDDAGEDDEFNYRLRDHGGTIWLTPRLRSRYFARGSLSELADQYFAYGRAKASVLAVHPRQAQPRQLAPGLLVLSLGLGSLIGVCFGQWRPLGLLLRSYGGFLAVGGLVLGLRRPRIGLLIPGVLATIHLAYGAGFLVGVCRRLTKKRA